MSSACIMSLCPYLVIMLIHCIITKTHKTGIANNFIGLQVHITALWSIDKVDGSLWPSRIIQVSRTGYYWKIITTLRVMRNVIVHVWSALCGVSCRKVMGTHSLALLSGLIHLLYCWPRYLYENIFVCACIYIDNGK